MNTSDEVPHILVVDDDASTRRTLTLIFEKNGYQVSTAASGQEALEKAARQPVDLALLDLRLPDIEGVELLVPFRRLYPDIALVLATGYASLETAIRALNEGADVYVTKPLDVDAVLAKVQDLLERQRLRRENRRLYDLAQQELAERKQAEAALREALEQANEARRALLNVIEDQKRTEEALAAERALLRTLVDHLPVAVYVKDLAGRKTLANAIDVRNIGAASEAEVLGKTDFDLYPRELAEGFHAHDQHVIESGQPLIDYEGPIIRDGVVLGWQSTSKVPMHDSAGQVIGLVGIGYDVTERKRAEAEIQRLNEELEERIAQRTAELAQTSERLKLATRAANIGIWDWDIKNDHALWDETLCMLFGFTPDDHPRNQMTFLQRVHPEDVERVAQTMLATLHGEKYYRDEYRIVLPDGSIHYIRGEASITYDAHGKAVRAIGINMDITERKRAELELRLFNEIMVGREQRIIELKEEINRLA
ncbi:MAG: response regulator, partial [Anaerolineae bacterium]|nr:response regulator [Anaerolineae bacterium]